MHAVCLQHEMDHLDGKLFVDYLSPLKQRMVTKKLEKQRKSQDSKSLQGRALKSMPTFRPSDRLCRHARLRSVPLQR